MLTRKLNVLITNAETMVYRQGFNYIEMPYNHNDIHNLGGFCADGSVVQVRGSGEFTAITRHRKRVYRIIPYDTSARSFWGEFHRSSMNPRIIETEVSYIMELEMMNEDSSLIDDVSRIKGISYHMSNGYLGYKTIGHHPFNLDSSVFMAPKLSDYSDNNHFKYYTLLV